MVSNEQILKKAIIKAQNNSWKPFKDNRKYFEKVDLINPETKKIYKNIEPSPSWGGNWHNVNYWQNYAYVIIFTHDFAKAFWGKENVCSNTGLKECFCQEPNIKWILAWKWHLSKMVLKEKPLLYLKQFLS